MIAQGIDADILATVNKDAINAPAGSISLQAGRDVGFGIVGSDYDNDVRAQGSITVNAGRDFLIDGFSDLASDDFGAATGGNVAITAGRNIHLRNVAGMDAGISASGSAGADVILTTGANGAVLVDPASAQAIVSSSGDVTVNADRILINSASGISAAAGQVTLRPVTSGREIVLGSAGDTAFALELSDAELDRIAAASVVIGGANSGTISVIGDISSTIQDLTLQSAEDLRIQAGFSAPGTLTLRAGNDLLHTAGAINAATLNAFVDTVGNDGGTGGVGWFGSVTATTFTVDGAGEADTIRGAEGIAQIVHGNGGNDRIVSSGEGSYFGDAGNDVIEAGLSSGLIPELLDGGTGVDTLDTRSFNGSYVINMATGATGFDYESFVNFENVITGDSGDTVVGTAGANTIRTNGGNDSLNGGAGADEMHGGAGDDNYGVENAGDQVFEAAGGGTDKVFSSVSFALGANVEHLTLVGAGNINGTGNSLANSLVGNAGNNILNGGSGADVLTGLGGNDTFAFDTALGPSNIDTITDFNVAADTISLDNAIFTAIAGTGTLTAAQFTANASGTAQDADDRIVYETDTGNLFYDSNGSAAGGSVQVAVLDPGLAVTNADFLIV